MKSDIFYWLLNMSLHGGLVCLIVLCLRKFSRLPKGFVYALWLLPALRLLLPFGLNSPWSLMALLEKLGTRRVTVVTDHYPVLIQPWPGDAAAQTPAADESFLSAMNSIQLAESYFPITYKTNVLTQVFETAALVWVIVAAACVLTAAALYAFTRLEVRHARRAEGYWISDRVTAPALYGIFRPRIILPERIPAASLPYILRHERIHARRLDNVWRCTAILICCIHWFNPLCWLCLNYFFVDMELACDAAVLRRLAREKHRDYALALLEAAQPRTLFVSAFGGAKIRVRIETVLSYKRLTAGAVTAFAALFIAIAATLILN